MFNTTDVPPRSEGEIVKKLLKRGKLRQRTGTRKLSSILDQILFAVPWDPRFKSRKGGEIQQAFDPSSTYNVSPLGQKIREAVVFKKPPKPALVGGTPATGLKALRPLGAGQTQPYSAPKGMHWATIEGSDIKPGEEVKEFPRYQQPRNRLDWKRYVRAKVGKETGPAWQDYIQEVRDLHSGGRVGKKELHQKTIRHIEGEMRLYRNYMAGGLKESRAIVRAKGAALESARAHPERMVEYKNRLEALTKKRQVSSKSAREVVAGRLEEVATRGMKVAAAERESGWQSKLAKLGDELKAAKTPDDQNAARLKMDTHYRIHRRTQEEHATKARAAIAQLKDKPVAHGGYPMSQDTVDYISDVLEKGNQTRHPYNPQRVRTIKKGLDTLYEHGHTAGREGIKRSILKTSGIFRTPIETPAITSGYPHLGKLGIGIGAAGLAVGAGLAIHAARKRSRNPELQSRLKEIHLALPPEAEEALNKLVSIKKWQQAAKTGLSTSSMPIPGTLSKSEAGKDIVQPWRHLPAVKKWKQFIRAVAGGGDVGQLYPKDMKAVRALQETHTKTLEKMKVLKSQLRTSENLRGEKLKEQAETLGAEHAAKSKDVFAKGQFSGREQQKLVEQARHEKQAGELTQRLGQESARRVGRLKLIAAGTAAAGGVGGYALGRHDKSAYQRHEARQILDMYKPRRPAQPRQSRPMITIGITQGYNGKRDRVEQLSSKLKLIRFQNQDEQDEGPEWVKQWAHKRLYGREYSTLGQAQKLKKWTGRTHRLVRDLNIKRQGLPNVDVRGRPRKNEWERPWVAGALTTAGIVGAYKGGRGIVKWARAAHPESRIGQLLEGFKRGSFAKDVPGLGKVGQFVHGVGEDLTKLRDKPLKGPLKYDISKFDPETGKMKTEARLAREAAHKAQVAEIEAVGKGKKYADFHSRLREIHFDAWGNIKKKLAGPDPGEPSSPVHDIATGAVEGGLAYPISEWASQKLLGKSPTIFKKIGVGGAVGGIATGVIGATLAAALRKRKAIKAGQQQMKSRLKLIQFQDYPGLPKSRSQRALVVRDRYLKQIKNQDLAHADRYYVHTALLGGGIGALAGKGLKTIKRRSLIGAGIGVGTQLLTRAATARTRDPFGERSWQAKRADVAPELIGTGLLGAAAIRKIAHKFSSRARLIQFQKTKWEDNPLYPEPKKKSIREVPIKQIVSHQDAVKRHIVEKYKKSPGRGLPLLHKIGSKYYVEDGNHRIVAKKEQGEKTVRASIREMRDMDDEIQFQNWKNSILFDTSKTPKREHNVAAGLLVAASGIPLYKGGFKMTRSVLRPRIGKLLRTPISHGKQVADYLEASRHVLNQGVTGKLAGMALRHSESPVVKHLVGMVPESIGVGSVKTGIDPLVAQHYSSFRASPAEALDAWAGELADARTGKKRATHVRRYRKVQRHFNELLTKGYNENEALRHVASDPQHEEFFKHMANYKAGPAKDYAKVIAGAAAIPATAGAGVAATTRKKNDSAAR